MTPGFGVLQTFGRYQGVLSEMLNPWGCIEATDLTASPRLVTWRDYLVIGPVGKSTTSGSFDMNVSLVLISKHQQKWNTSAGASSILSGVSSYETFPQLLYKWYKRGERPLLSLRSNQTLNSHCGSASAFLFSSPEQAVREVVQISWDQTLPSEYLQRAVGGVSGRWARHTERGQCDVSHRNSPSERPNNNTDGDRNRPATTVYFPVFDFGGPGERYRWQRACTAPHSERRDHLLSNPHPQNAQAPQNRTVLPR